MKQNAMQYFLGCTAESGFFSLFDKAVSPQSGLYPYFIKAGPGCGKSGLLRRLAARLQKQGHSCELIRCGSDPASLDGVLCPELGFCVLDATAPHTLEPSLPAACGQVVSLYDCLDEARLRPHADALLSLQREHAACMKRVRRLMGAAAQLYDEACRTAGALLQRDKLARYLQGLCSRELPRTGKKGSEQQRFCTNFTPDGFLDLRQENFAHARRILFCDRWGAMSAAALAFLREHALAAGYDIVSCPDPLAPETRLCALWLPQLQLCFMADGAFGNAPREGAKLIHAARFYQAEALQPLRGRLNFALRACTALTAEACSLMDEARQLHGQTERYYTAAMDFAQLEKREQALFARLLHPVSQ